MALAGLDDRRDLVAQNRALERPKLLARLQPELLGENVARAAVGAERVGLALAAIESEHELAPEAFTERLVSNETLQLGSELDVAPQREVGVDPLLEAREVELVQALGLESENATLGNVGECPPSPERERRTEAVRSESGRAAPECVSALPKQPLEPFGVELSGVEIQDVAAGAREQRILSESRAQPRRVRAQRGLRTRRRTASPELVD